MNRLKGETSPYLLQHAHNPVDWYPWGNEALQKAKDEGKPILVSIGYAACHWCHVMERESFEDAEVAAYMNAYFVNIKIDREERPDLDMIYMDALQALTGSGGWPLNVFLTPDARPFYGGTYFPPKPYHNMPAWKDVLNGVLKAFMEQRQQVEEQATELVSHIQRSNEFGRSAKLNIALPFEEKFTKTQTELAFQQALSQADKIWGGFGRAPKFPQTFTINFLLKYYHSTGNQDALTHACLSLDKMIMGGIYDHVGGGFARYATDTEWLVPHFEKMLYDNALLVMVLCDAYLITRKPAYQQAILKTLDFVEMELMNDQFAFLSALDADSEGVEGKYYVWSKQEVTEILGEQSALFCSIYDISEEGNWEHVNIPRLKEWPIHHDQHIIEECLIKLKKARDRRIKPQLDDKILLNWNALMNKAFSKAAGVLDNEHYRKIAILNMDFLYKEMSFSDSDFIHNYKNGIRGSEGFLDDYAYMIQALIGLYELTGEEQYLLKSKALTEKVLDSFTDEEQVYFYYTPKTQGDIIVRKKEIYDGATPSGNAVMAQVLNQLAIIFDMPEWRERSIRMTEGVLDVATRYPTSFGVWSALLLDLVYGVWEIAIMGEKSAEVSAELLQRYLPNKIMQIDTTKKSSFPIFKGKESDMPVSIFLCKKYACRKPVHTLADLIQLLENEVEHKLAIAQ